MSVKSEFVHVVSQADQPKERRSCCRATLDGHTAAFEDEALTFIAFEEEQHRVELSHPPISSARRSPTAPAERHATFAFDTVGEVLRRSELLRDKRISPAVAIAHGLTTSMSCRHPGRNLVRLQSERCDEPHGATNYMRRPHYAADSVGLAFDPDELVAPRCIGASVEGPSGRARALKSELSHPLDGLLGG